MSQLKQIGAMTRLNIRLQLTDPAPMLILTGKALVAFLMQTAQIAVVLALGALIFGYRPTGSLVALAVVLLSFSAVLSALGVALALWSRSRDAALSLSNIIGMLAAGIGGSFSTVSSFPDWAQHAARLSPAYWAITAIQEVTLDGAGLSDVGARIGVLWGFFAVIAGLALVQFRYHRE